MPRLRLRRLLLFLLAGAAVTMLALNFTSDSRDALLISSKFGEETELLPGRRPKFEDIIPLNNFNPSSSKYKSSSTLIVKSSSSSSSLNSHTSTLSDRTQVFLSTSSGERPWFMTGGTLRPVVPVDGSKALLWPEQDSGDRIVNQLMYMPPNYTSNWNFSSSSNTLSSASYQRQKLKKILLFFGKGGWNDLPLGRTVFLRDKCPVNTCELTTALRDAEKADALFFKDRFLWPFYKRSPNQVWILFLLECPLHTQGFKNLKNVFNWTATYRHDSDLVAPYEKFVPYPIGDKNRVVDDHNYAANKTKKVAWFVSNCNAKNKRLEYAKELAQYIDVDIYGSCGNKRCPRVMTNKCFKMLDKDYKFYLAFENSNCKDYITEKFFINGLSRNIVPIVMGAREEDYARAAPPHSYIHVDNFTSPKELAAYLHLLDKNDTLYNQYFRWKGTGQFINTFFWCRMCALLHAPLNYKSYPDMHQWWAGHGTCNAGHWKGTKPPPGTESRTDVKEDEDENG